MKTKVCNGCNKELSIDNFYKSGKQPGTNNQRYKSHCKPCETIRIRKNHWDKIRKILDVDTLQCELCGYDHNLAALDFHHLDEEEKIVKISKLATLNSTIEKYEIELAKCVVLCANCHREYHYPHLVQKEYFKGE